MWRICSVIAVIALAVSTADAYDINETHGGKPIRWDVSQLSVSRSLGAEPDDIPTASAEAAVDRAFTVWRALLPFDIDFAPRPQMPLHTVPSDHVNVVRWITAESDPEMDPAALAVTRVSYRTNNGQIVDADIVVNAAVYHWTTAAGAGCRSAYDLENIIAHEAGHFLGLGHSDHTDATMFAKAASCETAKRDLAADDRAGLSALYELDVAPEPDGAGAGDPDQRTLGCGLAGSVTGSRGGSLSLVWVAGVFGLAVRRRRAAIALAVVGTLSLASPSLAGVVRALRVDEMAASADLIVRGRIVAESTVGDGDLIYTDSSVAVAECLRPTARCPSAVTVRQLGGELDGVGLLVEGIAHLETGDEVLLVLRRRADGALTPVGMAQGAFFAAPVDPDDPGTTRWVRDLRGLSLRTSDEMERGTVEIWSETALRRQLTSYWNR